GAKLEKLAGIPGTIATTGTFREIGRICSAYAPGVDDREGRPARAGAEPGPNRFEGAPGMKESLLSASWRTCVALAALWAAAAFPTSAVAQGFAADPRPG